MNLFFVSSLIKNKLREIRLLLKYYHFHTAYPFPAIIFMVDGRCAHGGLVDRFKGIVTLYALSKVYNVPYYINYISPFNLNEVLCPNKYDWRITNEILDYSLFRSRVLVAYSEFKNPYRVRIDLKKQNHVYYGYNSLKLINEVFNTNFEWGELFEELFLPSEELRNYIDDFKKSIAGKYIALHFRFVHLLGDDFKDVAYNISYNKIEKENLIRRCREEIQFLLSKEPNGMKALITSDSNIFIEVVKNDPNVCVISGNIIHIDNQPVDDNLTKLKPFIDFYLLSEAQKIYSVRNKDMYPSGFPEYAAKIRNIPFTRIII
ncbi:hypothetical protein [Bacteroides fragilis]|uniref:hypothetical protein n=1 Tax=Bacteroides fragilis TaxID=817 RepID=UPI0032ECB89D